MPNVIQIRDKEGNALYPITDSSLVIGLKDGGIMENVMAWDGTSAPTVANIPAGVQVEYNSTTYTGTLAASGTTSGYIYLVASATQQGEYDRYIVNAAGGSYTWVALSSTQIVSPTIADNLTTNDATKALSAKQGKVLNDELSQLGQEVADNFPVSVFDHSAFASYNYNIHLSSTIALTSPGDYLEIRVRGNNAGYMLIATAPYNQPTIRYSSANTLQIRFTISDSPFNYQNAAVNYQAIQVIKISLDNVSGTVYEYSIWLDGNKIGTVSVSASTAPNWDNLGYQTTMDLYYIRGITGGIAFEYTKFADIPGASSVTDVYSSENYDGIIPLNNRVGTLENEMTAVGKAVESEEIYYEYHHASGLWLATHDFFIYQRLYGNVYIMTAVIYYDTSSGIYPRGYWRIERTRLVSITDGVVSIIQDQIITAGENEFVLKWLAGEDYNADGGFTGGYHFGEKIDGVTGAWVEFIVDGNRVLPTEDIPLTPCKSFLYREYSAIYNCHDNPETIAAWHLKETEFKDGGYETVNDVKFVQALDYFAYPGIVCVGRWLSEKAMPEGVATITDMGTGTPTISEQFKSNGHRIHYEGNGYMCDVESEVLIGADDAQCQRVVYNSTVYNKYYRRNPDTVGSTSNRLKGRTKVKISAM